MDKLIPYLSFCNVTKQFAGIKALNNINLDCYSGEVHALMGENGAGKSTLLKILSGNYSPNLGCLKINNLPIIFNSTSDALKAKIAIIYQEIHLIPEMTVAENIYLGQLPSKYGFSKSSVLNSKAEIQLKNLGMNIKPDTAVKYLSIGQCQMVEIAKALTRDAKIIAFDEPTSSLSIQEIKNLFKIITQLKKSGKVILYVSHRMEEIFKISDVITVFKNGKYIDSFKNTKHVNHTILVKSMVGKNISDIYCWKPRNYGGIRLEVKSLKVNKKSSSINFSVRAGEIVGLFGLIGAGRTELLKGIFGSKKAIYKDIYIDGRKVYSDGGPSHSIQSGIIFCSEDRKKEGIIPLLSVQDNINLATRHKHLKLGFIRNVMWEKKNALQQMNSMNIKASSIAQKIVNLSGGNQQKVILARWFSEKMKVILLDEPTRGIDVGTKKEIYNMIYKLASSGISVILVSSDLPEVLGVSDRVLVMREGKITGNIVRKNASKQNLLNLAMPTEAV